MLISLRKGEKHLWEFMLTNVGVSGSTLLFYSVTRKEQTEKLHTGQAMPRPSGPWTVSGRLAGSAEGHKEVTGTRFFARNHSTADAPRGQSLTANQSDRRIMFYSFTG